MKKTTIFLRIMVLAVMVFSNVAAFANSGKYYWFNVAASGYAPGNGKVYIGGDSDEPNYQDTCQVKGSAIVDSFGRYFYAQPSEEFNFVGWSKDREELISIENPAYISFKSPTDPTTSEDETNYSEEPEMIYACFGYIRADIAKGHEDLGHVAVYPLCNEAQEVVTLSAVANSGSEFDYWENKAGERFYEPDLEFTVSDPDVYTAHFTNPGLYTLRFEGDELIAFSHRGKADVGNDNGLTAYYFTNRMLIGNKLLLTDYNRLAYGIGGDDQGFLMKAEQPGEYLMVFEGYEEAKAFDEIFQTLSEDSVATGETSEGEGGEEEKEPWVNKSVGEFKILMPTLNKEVWLDELPDTCNYYTFDGKQFNQITIEGGKSYLFPENSAYLMLPKSMGTGEVITLAKGHGSMVFNPDNQWDYYYEYYLDEEEQGETDAIVAPVVRGNVKGAYDLQGRQVANPRSGVYVVAGKKVVK